MKIYNSQITNFKAFFSTTYVLELHCKRSSEYKWGSEITPMLVKTSFMLQYGRISLVAIRIKECSFLGRDRAN